MALARPDPVLRTLPVGTMWVDVQESSWRMFDNWINSHPVGALTVIAKEEYTDSDPNMRWYLFKVNVPALITWLGPGVPTFAEPNVTTRADTETKNEVESGSELLGKAIGSAAGSIGQGVGAGTAAGTTGFLQGFFSEGIGTAAKATVGLAIAGIALVGLWRLAGAKALTRKVF